MNTRATVLAGRIDAALDSMVPPELIAASLSVLARAPWERYCGDAKARRMCHRIATSGMTGLYLESYGAELPEWTGDVGGIARLAMILDAAARNAQDHNALVALTASREALVDGLLDPIRKYTMWNSKAREQKETGQASDDTGGETSRSQRRRSPRYDFAHMARKYCGNDLNAAEARALFYAFCFSTAGDILEAVRSSPELSKGPAAPDFKQYSARATGALGESRDCSAEVMCEHFAKKRACIDEACEDEDYPWWDEDPESPEERLQRLALPLFFEPLALARCYGTGAACARTQARRNPTLSARLAAA